MTAGGSSPPSLSDRLPGVPSPGGWRLRLTCSECSLVEDFESVVVSLARDAAVRAGWSSPIPEQGDWVICGKCLDTMEAHSVDDRRG